ncbi:MAG: response regulator, partial [Candidatus Methylomirabilales bacterium]
MIRVFIVTDIRLYREGLAKILNSREGLSVVGVAGSLGEAVRKSLEVDFDVALVDIGWPKGSVTVEAILRRQPARKVVALTVSETEDDVVACAEAGVAAYVARDGSVDDLVEAINSVGRGEMFCPPRIAAALMRRVAALAAERQALPGAHLTARESEILELISQGLSNKHIARRLGIQVATVKNHVHNIL